MILRALFISLIFSFFSNAGLIKNSLDINVTGKPIMFIFTSQTCPYCKKLKKDLVEVESLNKIAKEFDSLIFTKLCAINLQLIIFLERKFLCKPYKWSFQ